MSVVQEERRSQHNRDIREQRKFQRFRQDRRIRNPFVLDNRAEALIMAANQQFNQKGNFYERETFASER